MKNLKELPGDVLFEVKRFFKNLIQFEIPNFIYNLKVWYWPDFKVWFNCKRRDLFFYVKKILRNINFYIYVFFKVWMKVIFLQIFYFQPQIIYLKAKSRFYQDELVCKMHNKLKKKKPFNENTFRDQLEDITNDLHHLFYYKFMNLFDKKGGTHEDFTNVNYAARFSIGKTLKNVSKSLKAKGSITEQEYNVYQELAERYIDHHKA